MIKREIKSQQLWAVCWRWMRCWLWMWESFTQREVGFVTIAAVVSCCSLALQWNPIEFDYYIISIAIWKRRHCSAGWIDCRPYDGRNLYSHPCVISETWWITFSEIRRRLKGYRVLISLHLSLRGRGRGRGWIDLDSTARNWAVRIRRKKTVAEYFRNGMEWMASPINYYHRLIGFLCLCKFSHYRSHSSWFDRNSSLQLPFFLCSSSCFYWWSNYSNASLCPILFVSVDYLLSSALYKSNSVECLLWGVLHAGAYYSCHSYESGISYWT